VTTVGLAIKTRRRSPRKDYLNQTLRDLERAGVFSSPHLKGPVHLVDSDSFIPELHYENGTRGLLPETIERLSFNTERGRLLQKNAAAAIRFATSVGADWTLVLEDDIVVCNDFLGSIVRWLEDHSGKPRMYSFGANYTQIEEAWRRGQTSWMYPVDAFYGATSLAWRTEDALSLLGWLGEDPKLWNGKEWVRDRGHDLMLGRWGKATHQHFFLASAPCFVQHVGDESNRPESKGSVFRYPWPGPVWTYRRKAGHA
jgi:hypothetical protein